ncbi:MAG: hypothetical protein JKY19_00500, partial [Alcanivoracaceae bacterium]|nr:hypothetical protein [Alcanivoracaceae bacterium]
FAIERLNREVRNAVPNSVEVKTGSVGGIQTQCIEFLPVTASSIYIDIPVTPELKSNEIFVIPFKDKFGNDYQCGLSCQDSISIYPLSPDEIYVNTGQEQGKTFLIDSVMQISAQQWKIVMNRAVLFDDESPTQRAYISSGPVTYCHFNQSLYRIDGYTLAENDNYLFPPGTPVLMADNMSLFNSVSPTFKAIDATLQRNSLTQVNLGFELNQEIIFFNNDVHSQSTP